MGETNRRKSEQSKQEKKKNTKQKEQAFSWVLSKVTFSLTTICKVWQKLTYFVWYKMQCLQNMQLEIPDERAQKMLKLRKSFQVITPFVIQYQLP